MERAGKAVLAALRRVAGSEQPLDFLAEFLDLRFEDRKSVV